MGRSSPREVDGASKHQPIRKPLPNRQSQIGQEQLYASVRRVAFTDRSRDAPDYADKLRVEVREINELGSKRGMFRLSA